MTRTTINIDDQVLEMLRMLAAREGRTIGEIVSERLAASFANLAPGPQEPFVWNVSVGGLKVDIRDKDALARALGDQ